MPALNSVDGIASGLNTTEIIDAIIQADRRPAIYLEIQKAEKTNIVSTLKAFEAKLLGLKTAVAALKSAKFFEQAKLDISDTDYLSASSVGRVATGTYDLQVLGLAHNHQLASQGFADESQALFGAGTISIGVGAGSAQTITIDASNNSLAGIKAAINDADLGVTATIINDGSSSNPYRLLLTGDKTGLANKITITSNLTGGSSLNYTTSTFDAPELLSMDSGSDSIISLGGTASYTGSENKIYTFTVAGTGAQTVGTDNITIDWTDGTNSGSILVTQADTEFDLVGAGADGLKLTFAAGELTAGDTFQVSTFAPLLQEATDAKLAIGSGGGAGSPITVTSDTNTFKDVIGGVELQVRMQTEIGQSISVKVDTDFDGIKNSINRFISAFNAVSEFVDKQNTYNQDTKESGVLFGDYSLQTVQSSLRRTMGSKIDGLQGQYNQLYSLGIRTGLDGKLAIKDSARLEEALREDLDAVIDLFQDSGASTNGMIEFLSAGTVTRLTGDLDIDITQAATKAAYEGELIDAPETTPLTLTSSNNRLKLNVDGLISNEIILTAKTYSTVTELISEIQAKIDADDKIGEFGLTVEWVDNGAGKGYLRFESPTYGSKAVVSMVTSIPSSAFAALALAGGRQIEGLDVAGTINGEEAEGSGQMLEGSEDTDAEGIRLKITMTESDLVQGTDATVTMAVGLSTKLDSLLENYTKSGVGFIASRVSIYEKQAEHLTDRIADFDFRLSLRRKRLEDQFRAMEDALGRLNVQGNYLSGQLASLNSNWIFNQK